MEFIMNNFIWEIKYATADEVKAQFNDNNIDSYYYGCTTLSKQQILINKEATREKQKETLYHELMHCYIYCYSIDNMQYDEEGLCNISGKSHDIIDEIANDFLEKGVNNEN